MLATSEVITAERRNDYGKYLVSKPVIDAQPRNISDNGATWIILRPWASESGANGLSGAMTQRDLAKEVDVGAPHISKIEAGRESPSDELLRSIAEVLDCNFEELLLAARRMPPDLMERLALDPKGSLGVLASMEGPEY